MKKFKELLLTLAVTMASSLATFAVEETVITPIEEEAPLTPRTSSFRTFTQNAADEKYDTKLEILDSKKKLVIEDTSNKNTILGEFRPGEKLSEILTFLREISEGSEAYPITIDENLSEDMYVRLVSDTANERYIIATFTLLDSEGNSEEGVDKKASSQNEKLEMLGKRLEGFIQKARTDVTAVATCGEAKRLEGFGKKAGTDAGKARQNIRNAFKKLF